MQNEVNQLKQQVRYLTYYGVCSGVLILFFLFSAFKDRQDSFGIIRAKGIIIEDSMGKDRILIGAPIPYSANRVWTDTVAVRKYWAKAYGNPDQYMKWYRNYYHGAVGMVVMNDQGFDKVAVGEKLPDPNSGKRMFEASGLMWNDDEGWERGGLGLNKTKEGKYRSAFGLDDETGEAVHLVALEDGTKGLMISGETGHLMIGMSKKDGPWFQNKEAFSGAKFFDKKGKLLWEQKMN